MDTIKVKVIFWDKNRGEGLVQCLSSKNIAPIYACNLPGKRTWYAETACVYYAEGSEVDVIQDESGFVIGVTPGIPDNERWNKLDHSRLAFKCDDAGKAINGLFSK